MHQRFSYLSLVSTQTIVFHREIPFLRIIVPLCAGIVAGLRFVPGNFFIIFSTTFILAILVASRRFNKRQENLLFGLAFTLAMFLLGMILYNNEKSSLSVLKNEETELLCVLSDYPEQKPKSLMLSLKMISTATGTGKPLKGSVVVYLSGKHDFKEFRPGDMLVIRCTPAEIQNRGNPYEFNYRFYMENHGVKYSAFITADDVLRHDAGAYMNLRHHALVARNRIIGMYSERGVTDEMLPLVSALTLGEKSGIDPETKGNFIKAGIMHIMAVSGLHAMILSMFILNALFFLKGKFNILRVLIAVILIWCFAFITGLTPSVLRATLMFTFIQSGTLLKRRVNSVNSVLASAFVLILARPSVIFDAGFLLSYSAVIFIIVFYRDLYILIHPRRYITDITWQSAAVTITAQLGTLPLTIMYFNRFPVWFLITNLVIVPLSSVAIILGCLVPLLYIVKPVSGLIGVLLDRLTWLTAFLTEKAASLPLANISGLGMTIPECILLSLSIFLLFLYIMKKKSIPVFWPALSLAMYFTAGTVTDIAVKRSNELIVYNTPGQTSIGVRTGKNMIVLTDTLVLHPDVLKHCSTLGIKPRPVLLAGRHYISAGGRRIVIGNNLPGEAADKYKPDLMILGGYSNRAASFPEFRGDIVLLASHSGRLPAAPHASFHTIRKSGAYIAQLTDSRRIILP